jgi:hypothetical protein
MPHSIDPEPAENETECARCGAHFSIELTRCPNCGVNLYEPEDEAELEARKYSSPKKSLGARLDGLVRRLTRKPYAVDELFGAALNQAELFNDLLARVGGDRQAAERLVEYERARSPKRNRTVWIQNALRRLERDQGAVNSDR